MLSSSFAFRTTRNLLFSGTDAWRDANLPGPWNRCQQEPCHLSCQQASDQPTCRAAATAQALGSRHGRNGTVVSADLARKTSQLQKEFRGVYLSDQRRTRVSSATRPYGPRHGPQDRSHGFRARRDGTAPRDTRRLRHHLAPTKLPVESLPDPPKTPVPVTTPKTLLCGRRIGTRVACVSGCGLRGDARRRFPRADKQNGPDSAVPRTPDANSRMDIDDRTEALP